MRTNTKINQASSSDPEHSGFRVKSDCLLLVIQVCTPLSPPQRGPSWSPHLMQPPATTVRPSLSCHLLSYSHSTRLACKSILVYTPVCSFTVSSHSDMSFIIIEILSVLVYPRYGAWQLGGTSRVCVKWMNRQTSVSSSAGQGAALRCNTRLLPA